ncbi:MAG: hypothetical protein MUC90_05630 [Thermoplasmata archaeon]|jgi:hypothetical protein|nr:hypothetical protein [Thermoplasmata archaeon]
MKGAFRVARISVLSLIAIIVTMGSFLALSNPIAPPPREIDTTFRIDDTPSGILLLILMNILVNLFWICILLLFVGRRYGAASMDVPTTGLAFVLRVLSVAALVTLIGAFVDYAFVMGVDADYSLRWRVIQLDLLNWLLAMGIIFLSIVCAAYLFLRMTARPLLMLAGTITALNPVWWLLTGWLGNDVPMATMILSALILPIAVKGLLDLHGRLASEERLQSAAQAKQTPDAN